MDSNQNMEIHLQEFMQVNFVVDTDKDFDGFFMSLKRGSVFHFIAASSLVQLRHDPGFAKTLNNGYSICDSRVIEILSRFLGKRIQRIRGADFLRSFFSKISLSRRHLFIGSTAHVMQSLIAEIDSLSITHQEIEFVCPQFDLQLESQIKGLIKEVTTRDFDYIWIAMGSPKQDYIAHSLIGHFKGSIFCVGAAVDFVSGSKSEAPLIFQFLGIEWLYRLAQEPRRLFSRYTVGNIQFISLFCKWAVRTKFSNRSSRGSI
jgi:N-acetylglucosaminyldiphosphoundecaprenol N-acetyl-beta-D-mannosaminyltransferase